MRRPESVLVVVYTRKGLVLVMQRSDDSTFWQSVTGSLEANEAPLEAAHRELAEETGLRAHPLIDCHCTNRYAIRDDWLYRYPAGVTHNTEHVFLAELPEPVSITLSPSEHLQFEWVTVPQAQSKIWSPTNRQAIEQFVKPRIGTSL